MNFLPKRNNKVKDQKESSTKKKGSKKEGKGKKKRKSNKKNVDNKPKLTTIPPAKLRAKKAKQRRTSESGNYPTKNAQTFFEYTYQEPIIHD